MKSPSKPAKALTHFDRQGQAHMVDVGAKDETHRVALAGGRIRMQAATLRMVLAGSAKKGDVLGVARIAAIQGAKRACDLIPLAHPVQITRVTVDFEPDRATSSSGVRGIGVRGIGVRASVECRGRTGVEMEALAAVSAGLLTIYDMCKAVDRGMVIEEILLLEKRGGKSGEYLRGKQKATRGA